MKITKYYIDNAKYRAEDKNGNVIWLTVDYWNNKYSLSKNNNELSIFAQGLLNKKHGVNLWPK